ncbi:chorismate mutase [Actinocorallia libanotica]|uniref:Chorismate mutase n=1 Tax=Actinocorallia libanotica TaxID=46162 RepID=A0ABN1RUY1_9ACTN
MTEPSSLAEVRELIDGIDGELVRLLAERQGLVQAAATFKKDTAAVRAPDRVEQVITAVRARAVDAGLAPDVAEAVWRAMITAFIDLELREHAQIQEASSPGENA